MVHNIVIIGSSFSGIAISHTLFKSIIPALPTTTKYKVTMISPSKQFLFSLASLRAIVEPELIDGNQLYRDFLSYYDQYKGTSGDGLEFVHGIVIELEPKCKTLQVKLMGTGQTTAVKYDSLIIASGAATATPIFKLTTLDTSNAKQGMRELADKVKAAQHIAVGGAGPLGVELVSGLAEAYPEKKITLYTGLRGVLPSVELRFADEVEHRLRDDFKVEIVSGIRVSTYKELPSSLSGSKNSSSKVELLLTDGSTSEADLYIPASGETPNTTFLPKSFLDPTGRVDTDLQMRVPGVPRVYALGDCIKLTGGIVDDIRDHSVVLKAVLLAELPVTDEALASVKVAKKYTPQEAVKKTFVITLGRYGGVAMFKGYRFPSWFVRLTRAKDMSLNMSKMVVSGGISV